MSPRTNSQHSVHSAASDKASKASASPRNPSISNSGAVNNVKMEGLSDGNRNPGDVHKANAASPKNPSGQHGYAASMEGASGVPAKIDEAIEPD